MTAGRKTDAGNPSDWMTFAAEDLLVVGLLLERRAAFWVARSKLAEAFEKALKADLIARGWRLEKTHDLQRLVDHLSAYDPGLASNIQSTADELAESYTESRYPGFDLDDPDWPDLERITSEVESYVKKTRARLKSRKAAK